ncbi:DNA cytosine methyltransferase [Alkalihalobacillus sp. BA299]|uniref:DNA cytosine methyltransferase n=1 Tax=Alkalihalobacillus sp. BA299 TaxID=2815938 RepID=UPI001FFDF3C7|nr:DNA cytosine methyltransferase [Alkalihalobacillus sp. BA299]
MQWYEAFSYHCFMGFNMSIKMKKVYTVSQKAEKPRLFLQHLVCEAAGFKPGEEIYVAMNEETEEIIIQNQPIETEFHKVHVSSRVNKTSGKRRPLIDTAGTQYSSVIAIKQKVEICVFQKKGNLCRVVVRPLRYKMMENASIPTQSDERLRLLSVCSGAGIGTSAFMNGYFTPVMEIEYEDDSAENLKLNYPKSYLFNGDLKDCHEVAEADVVNLTLPCDEYSSLGEGQSGVFDNLILATVKIITTSKAKAIFMENVPQFYKSESFHLLKDLLKSEFPYWTEKQIESYEFGSIARRNRKYVCAFKEEEQFLSFQFPKPPKVRRKKLKDFLDPKHIEHEWKSLEKWMASFNSRDAWKDRSLEKSFVTEQAQELNCIPKRYRSHCASNSYVLNDEKTHWRFLSINEIRKILGVPEWFSFSEHIPEWRICEMLGQSVDCRVISAIANQLAISFVKAANMIKSVAKKASDRIESVSINDRGQLELVI